MKHLKFPVSEAKLRDLWQRMDALQLSEGDLIETYFKTVRSGGKAGLVGVMIFHPASALRIRCRRERSQGINRFLARRILDEELEKQASRNTAAPTPSIAALPPQHLPLPIAPPHWGLTELPMDEHVIP